MTTMSSSLLELILDLLSDEDEMKAYEANKDGFLFDRGLGGCTAEVDDAMVLVKDMAPAHAVKAASAPAEEEEDDKGHDKGGQDHGDHDDHGHQDHGDHGDHDDHGHKDHGDNVTNHYTTNNSTHNDNGDKYHISASDDGQIALNGGVNLGEEAEIEGDFNYEPEGSFNENGSGVQINGENAHINGDLNSAGGSGSAINTGIIDNSSTDVTVSDNVLQFGENNQNASDGSNQDTDESVAGGGSVDTVDDSIVVEDNKVDVTLDD